MVKLYVLIATIVVVLCQNPSTQSPYSLEGALNIFSEFVDTTLSTLSQSAGLSEICPYRDNVAKSVESLLPQYIRGQDEALRIIVNAVSAWEFGKRSGKSDALVLALTGSTGVGKSETAFRLAESMFSRSTRVGQSRRFIPNGLLVIRGEDYSEISEAGGLGVGEIYARIRERITSHLQKCDGKAIIVFDEVQKIMPRSLDVLIPALEEKGTITHTDPVTKRTASMSTSEVIFVFISDIGADRMTRLLLKYQTRTAIPINVLRHEVKQTLDEQWQKLQFGKSVNEVVPFLPMEQEHIQEVLNLKFLMLAEENKYVYWLDLAVDEEVVGHLSSPHFIKYVNQTVKVNPRGNDNSPAKSNSNPNNVGNNNNTNSASPKPSSKVFAKYGARALETGGPLQDIKSLFFRYMRPWRPSQVLHIGIANKNDVRISHASPARSKMAESTTEMDGGTSSSSAHTRPEPTNSDIQLFLQWCKFHEGMIKPRGSVKNSGHNSLSVPSSLAFSPQCETLFFGPLSSTY